MNCFDTNAHQTMSRRIPVASVEELAPGQRKLAFVEGRGIVLFNVGGAVCAIENACPHNGASLANGRLDGSMLQCPAHGLRFDVITGCMPAVEGLRLTTFPVSVAEGQWFVSLDTPNEPR
ncbi:Rieske (2Fe-2S) protein [Trinickia sp. YCB016]